MGARGLREHAGQLLAGNGPLAAAREDTRLMFQDARLLPWKRVIDNVGLGSWAVYAKSDAALSSSPTEISPDSTRPMKPR